MTIEGLNISHLATGSEDFLSKTFGEKVKRIQDESSIFQDIKKDYDGLQGREDEIFKVLFFEESDIYIRIDGVNDSYGDDSWNKLPYQVFPKEITITIYEKTK